MKLIQTETKKNNHEQYWRTTLEGVWALNEEEKKNVLLDVIKVKLF